MDDEEEPANGEDLTLEALLSRYVPGNARFISTVNEVFIFMKFLVMSG